MKTVFINARITEDKISEFFQVMEPLKVLIKCYCKELDINVAIDNNLIIRIIFDNWGSIKDFFNIKEFSILKGIVISLCNNVKISIND